jgi:chemotaxis protein MotA
VARREGLLALDRRLNELDDELLRYGLEMAVDGMDEDEISEMLDQRIAERTRRQRIIPNFFTTAGTFAPAFGMVGTLIGLIQMLQNLDDPTQIGAGMATAMVTTFYGALLANLVFLPLSAKAKAQNQRTAKVRYVVREGILAIARGDSPRMIEQRLGFFAMDEAPEAVEEETAQEPAKTQTAAAMA